ncbi:G-type lectin S-receptor-like serine/threonine-protein kinase SD2-5 [Spinacia oleracea]|uniref:Receptor-like serine/threonine-protein kinase n=1 Tax=Spinacia oleracea TaxID=3562 RepID=A0A9R0I848_SPIOL|nr:G-type lectin S-receptor-like serine/threonine-protein kinase SD2-5 [Spinacia oleracea]XP_056682989.1 G-type lectin S-receptor-like serine/threonine-protein kinase SD2-5 [Spinacia oleracea]
MTKHLLFCYILVIFVCFPLKISSANIQQVSQIKPGFQATEKEWENHNGMFLISKNSTFSFGFYTSVDAPFFVLVVMHIFSSTVIWTANRGVLVDNSAKFVFDKNGNTYLHNTTSVIWSSNTTNLGVTSMELKDNGNLVLLSKNQTIVWQSFDQPTDTLVLGQSFSEKMSLKSFPYELNLHYHLMFKSGDLVLFAGYRTPQVYWIMSNDTRKSVRKPGGKVSSATLMGNSWNFFDEKGELHWQFNISEQYDPNALWAAVLGSTGTIEFYNLQEAKSDIAESFKIPSGSCTTPSSCSPFKSCFLENLCQCPVVLSSFTDCKPRIPPFCDKNNNNNNVTEISPPVHLLDVGSRFDYPALGYTKPHQKSSISECKSACLHNCSCITMFYENSSRSCFMFGTIGSLRQPGVGATGYYLFVKVLNEIGSNNNTDSKGLLLPAKGNGYDVRSTIIIFVIVIGTILIVSGLIGCGFWYYRENRGSLVLEPSREEAMGEDSFYDTMTGVPIRYSYNDLDVATKNFSVKLGQGGFGSVYLGLLDDGTKLAVKKLEGVGQGKKEFRAEVSIIGSVHHVHLVKLKGFCAEGVNHRLLVYEYMENGSLDRWIFSKNNDQGKFFLDWEKRFNIALGTAKGLAYLHDMCDVKIIHCDIKPENVLLDENFVAKVSDFGLAKLMNKEQSHIVATLRGTRGYLAPEWITNCSISEKSDVYSYGMVLLEIIGGRKNYDPNCEIKEKAHLPSYAFKMMEQGRMDLILDSRLMLEDEDEDDVRVSILIKVALWCIQDDKSVRPSMTRVVQMLEGLCPVLQPPIPSQSASRIFTGLLRNSGAKSQIRSWRGAYNSTGNSTSVSEVQLSGPR